MIHRHLDYDATTPVEQRGRAAIDDILDSGDLDDWAPLIAAIAGDPDGALASAVLDICKAHHMYGTSLLWNEWITGLRRGARSAPRARGLSLAELRRRRGQRQADVAARMDSAQPDISKIESRSDVRVSTLIAYVAATGGRLICRASYPDEQVELDVGGNGR